MASAKKTLLYTGATGYVGGTILAKLLEHPTLSASFTITALLRSPEKVEKLRSLEVNAVVGSLSDLALVEKLTSESDFVISTADADNYEATLAILGGLKKRYNTTKIPPIFIHTSGTGVLADDARGLFSSEVIYDDSDPNQIETLAPTQIHRNVDLELVGADKEGYVRTYIILPSTIYGLADNRLVDLGIQNRRSLQVPALIRAALDRGQGGTVGKGKNIWPNVHIDEVAEIYIKLLEAISSDQNPGHGREGFYFGESGEHTLYDVGKRISEVLVELGLGKSLEVTTFTQEEIDKYFGGSSYLGSNSRCRANRSRALGWKPVKTTKDLLDSIKPEVEALVENK